MSGWQEPEEVSGCGWHGRGLHGRRELAGMWEVAGWREVAGRQEVSGWQEVAGRQEHEEVSGCGWQWTAGVGFTTGVHIVKPAASWP